MSPGGPLGAPFFVRYRYFLAFCACMVCVLGGGVLLGTKVDNTRSDQATIRAEQRRGQERDRVIAHALERIQASREEGVRVTCKLNNQQNAVLLSIIDFSVRAGRNRPPPAGQTEAERDRLTRKFLKLVTPITPERTKKVCDALLEGVRKATP